MGNTRVMHFGHNRRYYAILPLLFFLIASVPNVRSEHYAYYVHGTVRVSVAYRLANKDRAGDIGISSGTLRLDVGRKQFVYPLADILSIKNNVVVLVKNIDNGCGGTQGLAVDGHFLVIESVYLGKGCLATASFIDLNTGQVAENVGLDRRWDHRYDVLPARFIAAKMRVKSVTRVTLASPRWDASGMKMVGTNPWPFELLYVQQGNANPDCVRICV